MLRSLLCFIRLVVGAAVLFLSFSSSTAVASERVVISGAQPAKRKATFPDEGRTLLFGPVKLTRELKEAPGIVHLILEGVTFDPEVGSAAELYLVDAAGGTAQVEVDPANYIGSAASVAGGKPQTIDVILEINDFKAGDKEFKARTRLRTMNQMFVALVVKQGNVRFRRAVMSTQRRTGRRPGSSARRDRT